MKSNKEKPKVISDNLFPVVGIGASAGGLDAFKKLLKAIPEDSGMAYVLVQHLDPDHESLLPGLLQKVTSIPVSEISDEIKVVPDHIYIIPSNKMLVANDGVLQLSPRPAKSKKERNLPIDLFFTSLAEVHQSHAIGVVLSGTASDGTQGLKAIKDHGGITFAQDEESAAYDGMPHSARMAGVVDFVLPPEEIPKKLFEIRHQVNRSDEELEKLSQPDEDVFRQILSLLRLRKGTDFTYYKQTTIRRRILRRMALNKYKEVSDYLKYLRENKGEQDVLYQDLLIPVTSFFRDEKVFDNLCRSVFPHLIKNETDKDPIRIWVAGCSTGEEAYSMAICIKEFLGEKASSGTYQKVQIFATDISEPAIEKARTGLYRKNEIDGLSAQRLDEFFTKINGSYHIVRQIRDMCVFSVHNLLKDPPFGKIDFISCRNVLIYMDPFLQKKALTTFHYALNAGGFLLLGKSETSTSVPNLFASASKTDKIFTRKNVPGRFMHVATQRNEQGLRDIIPDNKNKKMHTGYQKAADDIMLSKYSPAGVVINEDMDIVHFRGDTSGYLEQSSGKPSHNLLKMAKQGLGFELRNILHKAKKDKGPVIKENIPLQVNGDLRNVSIEAIPLPDTIEPYYLVLFHETGEVRRRDPIAIGSEGGSKKIPASKTKKDGKDLRIQQLEQELTQAREDMRSITEDQEAANEELQSANEELLSSSEELQSLNEELETGKEELQSTNEELTVVNQEMISLNEQVTAARDYSENIIANIRESLLVLDENLRIVSANKSFYKTFRVNEQETEGVLIYDLGNRQWNIPALRTLLEKILPEKSVFNDFEVTHSFSHIGERTMLLNARAIKNEKSQDKLILLSIEDITEKKRAQEILNKSSEHLQQLVKELPAGVYSCDPQGRINFYNNAAAKLWGREPEIGKEQWCGSWKIFKPDGSPVPLESCPMAIAIKEGRAIKGEELIIERFDGGRSNVLVYPQPEFSLSGELTGAINMVFDITDQVKAIKLIEESEKRYRNLIYSSTSMICILKGEGLIIEIANDAILETWDKGKDVIGKSLLEVLPEIIEQGFGDILYNVYTTGKPYHAYEMPVHLRRHGKMELSYYTFVYEPLRNISGEIEGLTIIANEVTPQAELNKKIKESEQTFRQLAELMPEKVSTADAAGNITYYNESWLNYTGYSFEELRDRGWEKIIHPDDVEELTKRWTHSIATGDDFEMEIRLLQKNGDYNWHLSRSSALKDDNGKIIKWIAATTEIHLQKEQRLELAKAVVQRTGELSAANEELLQKNEELVKMNKELESFNYISSHDLQEPLRKIRTFANRILGRELILLSDKGKNDFSRIQDAASRMQTLIEDLLAYSRTNITERQFENTNLNEIVEESKKELAVTIEEKKAVIETSNLVNIFTNPSQFLQLMNNLIGNSLKFSKPDVPPHIIIKSMIAPGSLFQNEDAELMGRLSPQKEYCRISISDNGIGFDPRYKEQIFEVFQRLYGKDEYPGTGIGLAIVKKIVENHSGIVKATSEFGKGATFDIYIPVL